MKKFTCLLLIALAITSTMAANCAVDDSNHAFLARVKVLDATAIIAIGAAEAAGTTTACGTTAVLCCVVAKMEALVSAQQKKVRDAFIAFGAKVATIGGLYSKYATITNATAIGTIGTPAVALAAAVEADRSGLTADQFKALGNYSSAAFVADYTSFAAALPDCYAKYNELIAKIACSGCANIADAANLPYQWKLATGGPILVKLLTSTAISDKCVKVWNFMWKTGWFVQTVAYLNSKKGTGYTYAGPALNTLIFGSTITGTYAVTVDAINTAFEKCAGATTTDCTTTHKAVLTQAFVEVWGTSTTGVGRSAMTIIDTATYYSNARRVLPATTGVITVDETNGLDFLGLTPTWTLATPQVIATADMAAWSAGYVAASAGGGSSSSAGSAAKNAKVVIGTILSALFAIAFLN